MPKLLVIACSTRPTRVGFPIAEWTVERARLDGRFEVELADLRELNLPNYDEPHHPRLHQYQHEHTKKWSAVVERADAVVFVTPEYNHSFPGALKNAIDYLHDEWKFKPAAFVSYGGIAAGTRSVQALKPVIDCLRMIPVFEGINIAFVHELLKDGKFAATQPHEVAATSMFDTLFFWSGRNSELYVH
ncbi:NADPH-dependent FMN reductase [Agrobacterium vitis]|uniref:NAD(P)H-dependent oxidoreductase n=1 Tax=Agrobacterium vitis TaxID=373 RepID=A0AAE4X0U7_AGRVI|nr:NAD(P)H-dependent oxidoreductase [Agrobacterium vitis]MBF2714149.1 NAD(P)H-dependent oxidoreductase [Agrobacterium vitis]MUO81528.1 NADPH-dependent FMN reductase [Agrobacterium vitis]MUO95825.1 NADPH-dependent FMN reductase [Agrobacterium vitis]MVA93904.1 NADPH-dependent FMN reductase [Agrobacterium vitis]MVB03589.1 NADPH-dependent FMN reductase [Agrobacterium vitis]